MLGAVALVIGSGSQISAQLFSSGDALASRIANEFGEATGTWRSALIGLGVGAIAQVVVQILRQMTTGRPLMPRLMETPVVLGLLGGFAVMYATGMLVG